MDTWINTYYRSQIKQIYNFLRLIDSGIRIYLDYYMINFLKKRTIKSHEYNLFIDLSQFEFISVEQQQKIINSSKNCFEIYMNILGVLGKTSIEVFVYKFKNCFQSQDKDGCYNHINYYIGQGVRYICLKQIEYTHNSKTFKPFKHFVLRDSHTNMISQNDAEIIKAFNSVTKK